MAAELICSSCATENPQAARFCMACGTALELRCPSCGEPATAAAKFCVACGSSLGAVAARAPTPDAHPADPTTPEQLSSVAARAPEERRQVTVVFADLSGYTAVAERMDPEAVKGLVDRCLRRLADEVERFGGRVDKYIGDNVMAIFGAPVSHEDDAERAVRAALGMQDAMADINADLDPRHDVQFSLRVGVNSGEVVAGSVGDGYTVIGDTVNVASRLQAAAGLGQVLVGAGTERITRHAIDYARLEPLQLKGKSEPVEAWQALGVLAVRPTGRTARLESPFVGRDQEVRLLESLYERVVQENQPHLVTLVGQAGVGKSRLLRELIARLETAEQAPAVREGRCLAYGSGVVYWALGEVIRAEFGIVDADPSDLAWEKLSSGFARLLDPGAGDHGDAGERRATLLGRLLGIENPLAPAADDVDEPEQARESYFSAVRACFDGIARREPLVLVFEDIHWADHGMLDLIEYLARWVRGPVLILCLTRDELLERRPNWGSGRRNATSIALKPLTTGELEDLVATLLPQDDGRTEAAPLIADRAGGNPFFAEEMVRRLREEGGEAAELPDTVQAVLAARLDSLDPFERRLVQQAAVVGRTFFVGALAGIALEEERDLSAALDALEEKDIVVPVSSAQLAGETEFGFKHVLIRDVAYSMLPKTVRSRKHFEVGRFIEERAGDRSDEYATLLAEHYDLAATLGDEAGLPNDELELLHRKAVRSLEAAGDAAAAIYSNGEALERYAAALELRCVNDSSISARIGEKQGDVALRMGRVDAAIQVWEKCLAQHADEDAGERVGELHRKIGTGLWHKGETKQAIDHYQQGINLLKDGPPSPELIRLYEDAASLYMHTGGNMLAIYAAEKALRLAERLGETQAARRVHGIFGRVFGRIGDTRKARENLERSVELARESSRAETIDALHALGQHLELSEADYVASGDAYAEALALAQEIGDMPAQVELHAALALLAAYRADWDSVERSTEASADLAEREGLTAKLSFPHALQGLLAWRAGDFDGAERAYRRAHESAVQVGWSELMFASLFGLGLAQRDRDDLTGAAETLRSALDVCERAGLTPQSIQALSVRAGVLALAGREEEARSAAEEAWKLAERLPSPASRAAALEARGSTNADSREAVALLQEARDTWQAAGRPLEAARCKLLAGRVLADGGAPDAQAALDEAALEYEELGVKHIGARARDLAARMSAAS